MKNRFLWLRLLTVVLGVAAAVAVTGWSLGFFAVGAPSLEQKEVAQESEGQAQSVKVASTELSLVCPPGVVDPSLSAEVSGALEQWLPSSSKQLQGGGAAVALKGKDFAQTELFGAMISGENEGDNLSFLIDSCQVPARNLAVAAGATVVGENSVLIIANPAAKAVNVSLAAYGPVGPILDVPADLVVPAESSITVLPAKWAPDISELALSLSSDGAGVGAWLQSSGLDGEVPLGLSRVSLAAPQPVVTLVGHDAKTEAQLRIANTGQTATPVSIDVLTEEGSIPLAGTESMQLAAKSVSAVDLAGLPSDARGIQVTGETDLIASITAVTEGEPHPEVKGENYRARTIIGPTRTVESLPVLPLAKVQAAAKALGFTSVSASITVTNPLDEDVVASVDGIEKKILSKGAAVFDLKSGQEETPLVFSATHPVHAAYAVKLSSDAGELRSVMGLGMEGVLAQTRLVEILPNRG